MTPEQRASYERVARMTPERRSDLDDQLAELAALSAEYETADAERRREVYNRLLEIGAGMGSDGIWRARDPEWLSRPMTS